MDKIALHKEVAAKIAMAPYIIPAQRTLFKQGFSFSNEPFAMQLPLWHHIWKNARNERERIHAFFFLEQFVKKKEFHPDIWKTSVSWQDDVNGWGLCDALAKINTKILETIPKDVYKQLTIWNKDSNLWKRRQSVVSLLYFSRTKTAYLPFNDIAALALPLIADNEYYVQKGLGWTLREMHTVYPDETMRFLKKHITSIRPMAFTIAIEKMDNDRDILKRLRLRK
jgi:3-methyladenine DNA glycosylase AlkD